MSDRDDNDLSACETVNDLIRESGHERATGVAIGGYCRPDSGTRLDTRDGGADRVEEYAAEAGDCEPRTIAQLGATPCWPVRWCGPSPSENLALDPAPHVIPGLDPNRAGLDGRDPPFDLDVPGRFGIRVRRAVQAAKELSSNLRSSIGIQAQRFGKNGSSGVRHVLDSTATSLRDARPTGTMPAARVTSGRPSIPRDDESGNGPRKRCKTRAMIPRETVARGDLAPRNRGCP